MSLDELRPAPSGLGALFTPETPRAFLAARS